MLQGRIIDVDKLLLDLKATDDSYTERGLKNFDIQTVGNDYDLSLNPSLSIALPLDKGSDHVSSDGYKMIRGYRDLVKQNFRHLLLTAPGEKLMDKNFGVGLRRYLFENDSATLRENINRRIRSQVKRYLNYIQILDIDFNNNIDEAPSIPFGDNFLRVSVDYEVPSLQAEQTLDLGLLFNSADVSL
jgi:phage baseplate assembly protein W